jgi:Putative Flp pilus-assembly TadE/G-like
MHAPPCGSAHRGRETGKPRRLRSRDESGSILVLFSIFLTLFLLCCAVVIDVGYWWANAKKAQIAADSCALAAARELPQTINRTECTYGTPSKDYVLVNIPAQADPAKGAKHLSTSVISPYKGDISRVEATVRVRVRTFFGKIVGLDWIDLTRRAVAEKLVGEGDWAIYSHDRTGCDAGNGLEFDGGAGISINGRVHSNSRYHVNSGNPESGDQFWAKKGTLDRNTCVASLDPEPQGAAYGDGPEPRDFLPEDWVFEPWPAWYTPGQFNWPQCSGANFSARQINIKAGVVELKSPTFGGPDRNVSYSGNIPPGTYCATEQLTTSDSLTGTVTLLSPQLTIGGSTLDLSPYALNVLFFSVPNWNSNWAPDTNTTNDGSFPAGNPICTNPDVEMILNAGTVKWAGTIFNPCGRVVVNSARGIGGNPALVGTILGYMVKVNQNDFNMIGKDDFGGNINLALYE